MGVMKTRRRDLVAELEAERARVDEATGALEKASAMLGQAEASLIEQNATITALRAELATARQKELAELAPAPHSLAEWVRLAHVAEKYEHLYAQAAHHANVATEICRQQQDRLRAAGLPVPEADVIAGLS